MDRITITGHVTSVGIKRIVKTRFGEAPVASATLEDDTGRIVLNLWRDQVDLVQEGDVVRIENGFVRTYQDQLELNVGSRGEIVRLSGDKALKL